MHASMACVPFVELTRGIQVNDFFRHAPIDSNGLFDYTEFIRLLKNGSKDTNESLESAD